MHVCQAKVVKISIIGPESSGKSFLAKELADKFSTIYVPEFARQYLDKIDRKYTESDLLEIAQGQKQLEGKFTKKVKNGILFLDSDLIVMKIWSDAKYGRCNPWIKKQIESDRYDLYLLTYPDLPWKEDSQREYPALSDRINIFNLYKMELNARGFPYVVIRGQKKMRMNNAMLAILKHCPEKQPGNMD